MGKKHKTKIYIIKSASKMNIITCIDAVSRLVFRIDGGLNEIFKDLQEFNRIKCLLNKQFF